MGEKLRIQIVVAHPDDAEDCGGTIIKLAKEGHTIQILAMSNGQSGHHEIMGQKLVSKRMGEVQVSKERLGIDSYVVLDNNDGYLVADLSTRERLMKPLREFCPDVVITHRPYEYHPDVRNAALLVQDCVALIRVPNFLPMTPVPEKAPIVFYKQDSTMKPVALNADFVIDIDDVAEDKLKVYDAHVSQMYEFKPWWEKFDAPPDNQEARMNYLRNIFFPQWESMANRFRDKLIEKYGEKRGCKIRFAEVFEAAEFGAAHNNEFDKKLFNT